MDEYKELLLRLLVDEKLRKEFRLQEVVAAIATRSLQIGNTRRSVKYKVLSDYLYRNYP